MHPSLLRNDEQRGMRMNGSTPCTHHLKSFTCLSAVSFQMSASPTRNLQCMSCGRSMLVGVCRPRTWLLSRSHCRSSEMLGALGRPRNRVPFFPLFFFTRVGFRGLSIDSCHCSCDPFFAVACRFVPGLPCCLAVKLSLRLNHRSPCAAPSSR